MLKKLLGHPKTKKLIKIGKLIIQSIFAIVLIFTVFTLITSKTDLLGSIRSMVVLSGSMEPTIPTGSVIYTKKLLGYSNKDIVTFKNNSLVNVTHRIIDINYTENGTEYVTKGDANEKADTTLVPRDKVTGKVFFYFPFLGKIISALNSPVGFISLILVPAIFFILMEIWNIKIEIEKQIEIKLKNKYRITEDSSYPIKDSSQYFFTTEA